MWKQKIRTSLSRHANNWRGSSLKRKIVVIESDDWGSICMPSRSVYQSLLKKGYRMDRCPYASYDSLASEDDLECLFSLLKEYKDSNGSHPVITANTVMTNPDFEMIEESGFEYYAYEPFTNTLERYPDHKNAFKKWKEGIDAGVFLPQFHGREHLNIKEWMEQLGKHHSSYRNVFKDNVCWLGPDYEPNTGISMRATYDTNDYSDLDNQSLNLKEGLKLFRETFGYGSESFIAPNYIYHPKLDKTLSDEGVKLIQGMKYQKYPLFGNKSREMLRHTQGEVNQYKQMYLVRNCAFEPSLRSQNYDSVGECLKDIQNAFKWSRPAVITSHRLNYIGYVHPENKDTNLHQFRDLLHRILIEWPDVEFLTSVELGNLLDTKR